MTTPEPICDAVGDPIRYSSTNKKSEYYAAPKLAPQLALKNHTGERLKCPAFADPPK